MTKIILSSIHLPITTICNNFSLSLDQLSDAIIKENIGSEYRIGLKSFHDLYPSKVNEKITADAKYKTWDEKHKIAIAEASKRSTEFDAANTSSMTLNLN